MILNLRRILFMVVLMAAAPGFAHDGHAPASTGAASAITASARELVQAYKAHPLHQVPETLVFEFDDEQRHLLFATIQSYTGMLRPSMARAQLHRIEQAGLEQLYFIWSGSTDPKAKHYYRIQGPTILIEHQRLEGNHIHSLWRDPEQDFGRDLLLEHLENDHAIR